MDIRVTLCVIILLFSYESALILPLRDSMSSFADSHSVCLMVVARRKREDGDEIDE